MYNVLQYYGFKEIIHFLGLFIYGKFAILKITLKVGLIFKFLFELYNMSREIPSIYNLNMQRLQQYTEKIYFRCSQEKRIL